MNKILVILACCIVLVGCSVKGDTKSQNVIIKNNGNEIDSFINEIDGFERAEFKKFNSYASENGLKDTPIFVEGVAYEKNIFRNNVAIFLEDSEKNNWTIVVGKETDCNKDEIDEIIGEKIRACGFYGGYSDTTQMPTIHCEVEKSYISVLSKEKLNESENLSIKEIEDIEFVDGFEKANFNKFNSPASENGLGDTLIYIDGVPIEKIDDSESFCYIVQQSDGNKWFVLISNKPDGILGELLNENIRLFGSYMGYSEVYQMPAMTVFNENGYIQKINSSGKCDTIWTFKDFLNQNDSDLSNKEKNNSNSDIIYQLKELYKEESKGLSFSEENSETYFEIVLKTSKELSKRGENIELEEFVGDVLFNPFVMAAGYLCNNYNEDTEYGKVGNMAFDLIGYIVSKDYQNRDRILNDFDSIATEHGMEIITLDETEAEETKNETHTPTTGERNALKSAQRYLEYTAFSHDGLIEQLEYEKYSHEESTYAADNCGADWDKQAEKKAKTYIKSMAFSKTGLIEQLEFEKFTSEQAQYAAENCGADWNEQAVKKAKTYMDSMSFSRDRLIKQLEFEGFTHEQAVYGVEQNGY